MKDTLQLAEIAPYLPYNLPMLRINKLGEWKKIHLGCGNIGDANNHPGYKPILRPMSDLTKEVVKEIKDKYPNTPNFDYLLSADHIRDYHFKNGIINSFIEHCVIVELCKLHFDIHNLIGRGLAIDINTLNNE